VRCPYCGAEKELRVWTCAECGAHIQKPSKPAYRAAGWEWIPTIVFLFLMFCLPSVDPAPPEGALMALILFCFSFGFAFSAVRDRRTAPKIVGFLCLAIWVLLMVEGLWPLLLLGGYITFILALEHVVWWIKLARM
jgi:hypothetical protein